MTTQVSTDTPVLAGKLKTIVVPIDWLPFCPHGWGNGYVLLPRGHPAHGLNYYDINVDVHGGLTFADLVTRELLELPVFKDLSADNLDCWMVGFDTVHAFDGPKNRPESWVRAETARLEEQLRLYSLSTPNV